MNFYLVKLVLDGCCFIDEDGLFNGISYYPLELDGVAFKPLYVKPKHSHAVIITHETLPETVNVQLITEQEAQVIINEHLDSEVGHYHRVVIKDDKGTVLFDGYQDDTADIERAKENHKLAKAIIHRPEFIKAGGDFENLLQAKNEWVTENVDDTHTRIGKIKNRPIVVKDFVRDWDKEKHEQGAHYNPKKRKYMSMRQLAERDKGNDTKRRQANQMTGEQQKRFFADKQAKGFKGI